LIVKYKPEERKEETIETNKDSVAVMTKNILLNYTEALLKFL